VLRPSDRGHNLLLGDGATVGEDVSFGANVVVGERVSIGADVTLGPNVVVGVRAVIGRGVTFGANVVVHDETVIGDGCFVQDGAVIGKVPSLSPRSTAKRGTLEPLRLGARCVVCTGAVVYRGTTLGPGCIIGDLASVRERCVLGESVVVGRGTCVEMETTIGDFTKIQSNCYITAYMLIEDHVFIAPNVMTTNDNFMGRTEKRFALEKGPTIRRGARVGGGSVLLPAVEIGEEAFVASASVVTRDVAPRTLVMGTPAKVVRGVPDEELLENQ
jgi:acetyltransferase-like isoleucine patch superfamily enzyme